MSYQVEKKETQIFDIRNEVAKHQASIVAVERLSDFIDSDACETFDDASGQVGHLIKDYGNKIEVCVDELIQAETELEQLKANADAVSETKVRLQEDVDHIADTYNNPDDHKDEDDSDDDDDGYDENPYDDVLDITYHVGTDNKLKSVELLVGYGGPNLYVDTSDNKVKGYWGGDYAEAMLDISVGDEITEYFSELFDCR